MNVYRLANKGLFNVSSNSILSTKTNSMYVLYFFASSIAWLKQVDITEGYNVIKFWKLFMQTLRTVVGMLKALFLNYRFSFHASFLIRCIKSPVLRRLSGCPSNTLRITVLLWPNHSLLFSFSWFIRFVTILSFVCWVMMYSSSPVKGTSAWTIKYITITHHISERNGSYCVVFGTSGAE